MSESGRMGTMHLYLQMQSDISKSVLINFWKNIFKSKCILYICMHNIINNIVPRLILELVKSKVVLRTRGLDSE